MPTNSILVEIKNGQIKLLQPIDKNIKGRARLIFEEELNDYDDIEINPAILSEKALMKIWDNPEDDIYNDL